MDQLLEYDWELALGDKVLTAEEMTRLVDAKSDLVQLRGEWVQADKDVLARAARFVSQRHSSGDRAIVDLIKDLIADDLTDLPVEEVKATGWASALLDQSVAPRQVAVPSPVRSEEHTSELQSLMRNSYAVFCLKQKQTQRKQTYQQ